MNQAVHTPLNLSAEPLAVAASPDRGGTEAAEVAGAVAAALARCDLRAAVPAVGGVSGLAADLAAGLEIASAAIRQAVTQTARIAEQAPAISEDNAELSRQSTAQVEAVEATQAHTQRLTQSLAQARRDLEGVGRVATQADEQARAGRESAQALAEVMSEIRTRATRIGDVTELIDQIAFQTNLLALNAAVEAARAGESGRGFAVVAQEVRALAQRAAAAARDVHGLIEETRGAVARGQGTVDTTAQTLRGLGELVENAGRAMAQVAGSISEQSSVVDTIERALAQLAQLSRSNLDRASQIAQNTDALRDEVAILDDCVHLFRLADDPLAHPRHAAAHACATQAAIAVAAAFEQAVVSKRIKPAELFSREYQPIAGTSPQKFSTAFDALCDELLPPIQEPLLVAHPWIAFAISANCDGYVPTHNLKFCKALTGDPGVDLVGNRTKRIFDDRVGRTVGAHTDPYRLQVYRRDTGELMFDLSVPVVIRGYHWGGFRVGYYLG